MYTSAQIVKIKENVVRPDINRTTGHMYNIIDPENKFVYRELGNVLRVYPVSDPYGKNFARFERNGNGWIRTN